MFIQGLISFKRNSGSLEKTEIETNDFDCLKFDNGFVNIKNQNQIKSAHSFLVQVKSGLNVKTISNLSSYSQGERFFDIEQIENNISIIDLGIWYDEDNQKVKFLRNAFGTVPLFYIHIKNEFIAFSTDLPILIKMEQVKNLIEIDITRIIRYCTFKGDGSVNYDGNTFFTNIKLALPGHILTIDALYNESVEYFKYNPLKWGHLKTLEEYSLAIRDLLFKSVARTTVNNNSSIGSHLSGGLDSSSLSSITRAIYPHTSLSTFYASTKTKFTSEEHFAIEVSEKIESKHFEIEPAKNDFQLLKLYISLYGQPECMSISPSLQGTLIENACAKKCEILLIGHDGDSIMGTGLEYITELFLQKNWNRLDSILYRRLENQSNFDLSKNWNSLPDNKRLELIHNDFFGRRLAEIPRKDIWNIGKLYFEIHRRFNITHTYFIKKGFNAVLNKVFKRHLRNTILKDSLLNFKGSVAINKLSNSLGNGLSQALKDEISSVYTSQSVSFTEELFALGNHYGIQNKLPFMDKDLFELCLAIPGEIKLGPGLGRNHFREAMKGILPENVRTRPDKAVFSLYGRESAIRMSDQARDFLSDHSEVWEFIDRDRFLEMQSLLLTDNLPKSTYSKCQFHIIRTISLALWLEWINEIKK